MTTDTSEKGLETLIEKYLLETNGYFRGMPSDYSTDYALDWQTRGFSPFYARGQGPKICRFQE